MYRADDRIAEVSIRMLQVSAGKAGSYYTPLGRGVSIKVTQLDWGFKVYARAGMQAPRVRFLVKTTIKQNLHPSLSLKCWKCGSLPWRVFLDWDSLTGICMKCYKPPKGFKHTRTVRWIETSESTFRTMLKKRINAMVTAAAIRNFRALNYKEFFALYPYLVPPFLEQIASYDEVLHRKVLRKLFGFYKKGIYLWKVAKLPPKDNEWLDHTLAQKIYNLHGILKGEREWMKANLTELGTPQGQSTSPPLATGSSSSKTSSSPATNADTATAKEKSVATSAKASGEENADTKAEEKTPKEEPPSPSNAPNAQEPGSSNAPNVKAREDSSLSLNSPSDDPVPEESCLQEIT